MINFVLNIHHSKLILNFFDPSLGIPQCRSNVFASRPSLITDWIPYAHYDRFDLWVRKELLVNHYQNFWTQLPFSPQTYHCFYCFSYHHHDPHCQIYFLLSYFLNCFLDYLCTLLFRFIYFSLVLCHLFYHPLNHPISLFYYSSDYLSHPHFHLDFIRVCLINFSHLFDIIRFLIFVSRNSLFQLKDPSKLALYFTPSSRFYPFYSMPTLIASLSPNYYFSL